MRFTIGGSYSLTAISSLKDRTDFIWNDVLTGFRTLKSGNDQAIFTKLDHM